MKQVKNVAKAMKEIKKLYPGKSVGANAIGETLEDLAKSTSGVAKVAGKASPLLKTAGRMAGGLSAGLGAWDLLQAGFNPDLETAQRYYKAISGGANVAAPIMAVTGVGTIPSVGVGALGAGMSLAEPFIFPNKKKQTVQSTALMQALNSTAKPNATKQLPVGKANNPSPNMSVGDFIRANQGVYNSLPPVPQELPAETSTGQLAPEQTEQGNKMLYDLTGIKYDDPRLFNQRVADYRANANYTPEQYMNMLKQSDNQAKLAESLDMMNNTLGKTTNRTDLDRYNDLLNYINTTGKNDLTLSETLNQIAENRAVSGQTGIPYTWLDNGNIQSTLVPSANNDAKMLMQMLKQQQDMYKEDYKQDRLDARAGMGISSREKLNNENNALRQELSGLGNQVQLMQALLMNTNIPVNQLPQNTKQLYNYLNSPIIPTSQIRNNNPLLQQQLMNGYR